MVFPSALAAVREDSRLRVYEAAEDGSVREVLYEGRWTGGSPGNTIATGKVGSPVAATSIGLQNIRVYYVDNDNHAKEAAYDGNGWYKGAFNFEVAPHSSISAVFLEGQLKLRVYGQLPNNSIQEWTWDGNGWAVGANLGPALPGTSIAATSWGKGPVQIRVYFQDGGNNAIEKAWDNGWKTGGFHIPGLPPRASLGVTSWEQGGLGIRVYYAAPGNVIKEKAWDGSGGWYDGAFSQTSIPGSRVAAIPLPILRVYLQSGSGNSAVTEYMWNSGWSVGQASLPRA